MPIPIAAIRSSISRRLTALNMLVSGTAVLLACAGFFAYDLNSLRLTISNNLEIQAQIIGSNAVSSLVFNDPSAAEFTLSALQASPNIVYAGIYNPSGNFFAGYWRDARDRGRPLLLPAPSQPPGPWFRERQFATMQPMILDHKAVGTVYIRSSIRELVDRLYAYLAILAGILLASLSAALFVSRIAQRAISEPIGRLAETARRVSLDRNYALRATPTGTRDEIGALISSFNEMLAEIQKRDADLQESEQQFRTLADSVPQLAWTAEADGYITWYNRRWYEYTGRTEEEMRGWGWESVHDSAKLAEVQSKWRASLAKGVPFEMVFPLRRQDGEFRDFLTMALPVRDAQGMIVRWFGTNTDITEQLRSEEALRRSEKLAATGRLAASIAHEINNPLEAVTNLLYLARKNPAKAQTYIVAAEQELERITEITRQTLGFYRDTSTQVRVRISEVIQLVLFLYRSKLNFKKIVVKQRLAEDAEIFGLPGELRQIFANLIVNAIEAMGPGGVLTVKTATGHDWGESHRRGIRVTLMDTGSGIKPDQLGRIFEAFYTTKQDTGTGLGLWLTRSLVEKHQGTIRVRSRTGPVRSGTVFSLFFLETQDAEHGNAAAAPPVERGDKEGLIQ